VTVGRIALLVALAACDKPGATSQAPPDPDPGPAAARPISLAVDAAPVVPADAAPPIDAAPPPMVEGPGPAPENIRAWRADPNPKPADQAWAKVEIYRRAELDHRSATLGRDASFTVARALERQLLLCAHRRAAPAGDLPARRAAIYFRNMPLEVAGPDGAVPVWSALFGLDGSKQITTIAGDGWIVWSGCPPCPLYHSRLRRYLPVATRRTCAARARADGRRPPAIEPTHASTSWAVYLAASDDHDDPVFARTRREIAALGYNALDANIGCDTSAYPATGEYMLALYFRSRRHAQSFARLREPLWTGRVASYCLD
jgi:hypothetical protein